MPTIKLQRNHWEARAAVALMYYKALVTFEASVKKNYIKIGCTHTHMTNGFEGVHEICCIIKHIKRVCFIKFASGRGKHF